MSIFCRTLQVENAGLDLCVRIAAREIALMQRPRAKEYAQSDADRKRDAERIEGLMQYVRKCGLRKEGNLEAIESGKCLGRIHDVGKIDFAVESNRVRHYAATGEWRARQFEPGPEPYQPVTLEEIDAMIGRMW